MEEFTRIKTSELEFLHGKLISRAKEIERLQAQLNEPETEEMPDGKGHVKAKKSLDGLRDV